MRIRYNPEARPELAAWEYYIDEPEADAVLKEQVNLSTAQRRASQNVPELRRQKSSKKFDFLEALKKA